VRECCDFAVFSPISMRSDGAISAVQAAKAKRSGTTRSFVAKRRKPRGRVRVSRELKRSGHACCLSSYPARHEDFATGFQDAVLSPRSLGTVLLSEPTTIAHVMARHEGCPVPIWLPTFVEAGIPWALRYLRDLRRDRPHRRTRRLATIGANRLQSRHFQRVAGASCPVIAGVALEAFGPLLGQSADLRSRQLRLCIGREAGVPGRGPACL
jgi:hypothetical protein